MTFAHDREIALYFRTGIEVLSNLAFVRRFMYYLQNEWPFFISV